MPIITIAAQKGGVGKTATAAALGAGLRNRGRSVLYIDLDPQANLSAQLRASRGLSVADILTGKAKAQSAIQHTAQGDIIPADARLSTKGFLYGRGDERLLRQALEPLQSKYDFILIDTPPSLGALTVSAMTAAKWALLPAKADRFSLDALREVTGTIREIQVHSNRDLQILGVVITMYNARTTVSKLIREKLTAQAEELGVSIYDPPIRRSVAIEEAEITGTIYDSKNNAREDYDLLIDHILQRIEKGR